MNRSIVEVIFKVNAKVRMGEEVRVSGNVPALGCNTPERAVSLVTSQADYPCWSCKEAIFLPGDNGKVNYRYCIFSGGVFKRWEVDENFHRQLEILPSDQKKVKTTTDIFGSKDVASSEIANLFSSSMTGRSSMLTTSDKHSFKSRQMAEWGTRNNIDFNLHPNDGVIIVSYFLPVNLHKSTNGTWSATWDEENVLALQMNLRTTWVGSVRYTDGIEPEDEDAIEEALRTMNCHPIFINANSHHQFYDMFCKKNLWPVLHHIADVYGPLNESDMNAQAQQDLWFTYTTVNRLFKDKIVEVFHEGDLIWIQGFHLMLLPSFLRRVLPQAKIGMFFHTPFPSSEIWRTMNRREDLLRGMLSADQIGFHLYEYARHFLTGCRRMLGLHYEMNAAGVLTINVDGRDVCVTNIHMGVDISRFEKGIALNEFKEETIRWKSRFPNRVIIAGIDRMERLKGIPLKLLAIEQLMQENPQWKGKLAFVMIGVSAGERASDYRQTQHDVKYLVNNINMKYSENESTPLIHFEEREERDISLVKRLAFFAASDILMVTPARDGLNRMPIEFTLARSRAGHLCQPISPSTATSTNTSSTIPGGAKSNEGLVIISEFVSSARVMRGSLVVNPYRTEEVKNALKRALEMGATERSDRMRRNLEFSLRLTTVNWAIEVLKDLKQVHKSSEVSSFGLGAGFRVMGVRAGFNSLDTTVVSKAYRHSNHRLIMLDWGGTLVAEGEKDNKLQFYAVAQGHATRSGPTDALKAVLEGLCSDPKNMVFVVSGKDKGAVTEFFGDIRGLNLGAEHGFFYLWPENNTATATGSAPISPRACSTPRGKKWRTMVPLGQQLWKEAAMMVMDVYVQRTHGSYIEQKGHALIWQFRDADPEFGYLQSKELEENLFHVLSTFGGVDIIRGGGVSDGYIEVRPSGISKGLFVEHVMATLKSQGVDVDFLLTVGDDTSDEPMFSVVEGLVASNPPNLAAFSVTVGKKPTAARAYVDDPAAVMELLGMFTKVSYRAMDGDIRNVASIDESNVSGNSYVNSTSNSNVSPTSRTTMFVKLMPTDTGSNSNLTGLSSRISNSNLTSAPSLNHSTSHRRVASNKSFDRLAIEIQAQTSQSASKSDNVWRVSSHQLPEDDNGPFEDVPE
eukprot:gene9119-18891_t